MGSCRIPKATGDRDYLKPIEKASELFLEHNLFRSDKTGQIINPEWSKLHYPLYWHYDILQVLTILSRAGKLDDPRTREALDVVEGKRTPTGSGRPKRAIGISREEDRWWDNTGRQQRRRGRSELCQMWRLWIGAVRVRTR